MHGDIVGLRSPVSYKSHQRPDTCGWFAPGCSGGAQGIDAVGEGIACGQEEMMCERPLDFLVGIARASSGRQLLMIALVAFSPMPALPIKQDGNSLKLFMYIPVIHLSSC